MKKRKMFGVEYKVKDKPEFAHWMSPTFVAIKLYGMCWSVAHIARYIGISANDVRTILGLK